MKSDVFNFWSWFIHGFKSEEGKRICNRGFSQLFDWWFLAFPVISMLLSCYTNHSICDISRVIIIPLMSVMIGLSVAWIGSTFSIAMTDEVFALFKNNIYELVDYLYMFQAILLVLLVTVVMWVLASITNTALLPDFFSGIQVLFIVRFILFFMLCMSVRECWQLVVGSYMLIISHLNVKEIDHSKE